MGSFTTSFHEVNNVLVPKLNKDTTIKEYNRPVSLVNIDIRMLANQIQQHNFLNGLHTISK